ncbi:MAG: GNAT family N-acetyltransferase [bacterium]|nr:GNAT family N-acetyltransferase [bacterium]
MNVPIDKDVYPEIIFPEGVPYEIWLKYKKIYIAWARLNQLPDGFVRISHIETRPEYRKQGWASKIVRIIQEKNVKIETNVYSLSQPSAKMLLKLDFKIIKPMFKSEDYILSWEKTPI